jgi:hypothetical protein
MTPVTVKLVNLAHAAIARFPNEKAEAVNLYRHNLMNEASVFFADASSEGWNADYIFDVAWLDRHENRSALRLVCETVHGAWVMPGWRAFRYVFLGLWVAVIGVGVLAQHFFGPAVALVSAFICWAAGRSYVRVRAHWTIDILLFSFFASVGACVAWLAPIVVRMLGSQS